MANFICIGKRRVCNMPMKAMPFFCTKYQLPLNLVFLLCVGFRTFALRLCGFFSERSKAKDVFEINLIFVGYASKNLKAGQPPL